MVKAVTHKDHYLTKISSDTNSLIADESKSNDGTEQEFSPMELLAASLASCTSITLRMYADRKEWDLKSIEVTVKVDRNTNMSNFNRNIQLIGKLETDQITQLLDIANHCPVHKILNSSIIVNTTLL
jgi:putative redox protein